MAMMMTSNATSLDAGYMLDELKDFDEIIVPFIKMLN